MAALDEGYLGMGSFVRSFEDALSAYMGGPQVVAVSSGTAALHLAVQSAGIGPGDEVILPSLTFVACAQAITATGATPVFCEIDPATGSMDLADAEARATRRTRAIMPVHYSGRAPVAKAARALARRRGWRCIEDAAHGFGTLVDGVPLGGGDVDILCYSFDGIKNITCGEGGAIVTRDPAVARKAADLRLLGIVRDSERRYAGQRTWEPEVTEQGWRYHMSNVFAALGHAQLKRFDAEIKPRRQALARRYHELLAGVRGIALFPEDPQATLHIFPVRVLGGRRDTVRDAMIKQGIEVGVHYFPSHLMERFGAKRGELPRTEALYEELLTLPLHPEITREQQDAVVHALVEATR